MLSSYLSTIEVVTLDYMQRLTTKHLHEALERKRRLPHINQIHPPKKLATNEKSFKIEQRDSLREIFD